MVEINSRRMNQYPQFAISSDRQFKSHFVSPGQSPNNRYSISPAPVLLSSSKTVDLKSTSIFLTLDFC